MDLGARCMSCSKRSGTRRPRSAPGTRPVPRETDPGRPGTPGAPDATRGRLRGPFGTSRAPGHVGRRGPSGTGDGKQGSPEPGLGAGHVSNLRPIRHVSSRQGSACDSGRARDPLVQREPALQAADLLIWPASASGCGARSTALDDPAVRSEVAVGSGRNAPVARPAGGSNPAFGVQGDPAGRRWRGEVDNAGPRRPAARHRRAVLRSASPDRRPRRGSA
jgi:hypothetical protein